MASDERSTNHCEYCGEDLFQLEGDWYCPACDSVSGFELVPDRDTFEL
jgi:uncharacterized Zn finger protein (UPF0148 family)